MHVALAAPIEQQMNSEVKIFIQEAVFFELLFFIIREVGEKNRRCLARQVISSKNVLRATFRTSPTKVKPS